YPVITLEKEWTHLETRENLIGKNASEQDALKFSIYANVDENYPATFIWCGDADSVVPPKNTKLMVAALEEKQIPHESYIFPGVDHGVGPGTNTAAEGWINRAVAFWRKESK
ncbi:MAG: S9 family peptidase, partial [Acetatifactor sp.]|nr:S9 family peptidase [Acetatifactor sp.]